MKSVNPKVIYFSIIIILIIKFITIIIYPYVGGDGPWSLSSAFSYYNNIIDSSVFAHDYLGPIFTVHLIDFCYSIWFNVFGIGIMSFVSLEFLIIISTIIIWAILASRLTNKNIFYLLMLGYSLSPYVYGFRPENLCILIISLSCLVVLKEINESIKAMFLSFLAVFCGLIHHVGGLLIVAMMIYYYLFIIKGYISFAKFVILGILFSVLLTKGEIINYLLLPTKLKSESDNHFSVLNFNLLIKYLLYSGPIPILVIYLFKKIYSKADFLFFGIMIVLLSFLGRSYYMPYLFVIIIFVTIFKGNDLFTISISNFESKINNFFVFTSLSYSFFFLMFIPVLLINLSPKTNSTWRSIESKIAIESTHWSSNVKYFVPSELALQVVSNKQARLFYSFMLHNDGIQDTSNKVFYITNMEELKWLKKNFNTSNKRMKIQEIVKETEGHIIISSIYKFRIIKNKSVGLWKIIFTD